MYNNCFLTIFSFFGFYPSIEKFNFGPFASFIHFNIILGLIIYVGMNQRKILYSQTPIGNINDILLLFSLYFAHIVSVAETYVRRRYLKKFWDNYKHVKRRIKLRSGYKAKFIVKSILFWSLTIAIEAAVITNISSDAQWTLFWYYEIFSLLMTRLRHFQQLFFVEIIFVHLQEFNKKLLRLILWTKCLEHQSNNLPSRFFRRKFSKLKFSYQCLMTMIICVNKVFCWSQVLNFGQQFIEVTVELYWIYVYSLNDDEEFLWRKLSLIWLFHYYHLIKEKILMYCSYSDCLHSNHLGDFPSSSIYNIVHQRGM